MKRLFCGLVGVAVALLLMVRSVTLAETGANPAVPWATPSVMALKKVGPLIGAQHQPTYLSNLDCMLLDYRFDGSTATHSGCFVNTAFGFIDTDTNVAIFNGTDEAVNLLPYASQQLLVPWPRANNMLSLNLLNGGGASVSQYRYVTSNLLDGRNLLGYIVAKQITTPPVQPLVDASGHTLVINPQSLAFSNNGSWLIAETPAQSFERINLTTERVVPFAPGFGAAGSPGLAESQVAVSDSGQYVAIYNAAADSFKVYDLQHCTGSVCASYDYQPFVKQQIAGLQKIRHLRFVNEGLLSFETQTSNTATSGIYEIAPTAGITSLIDYLGTGDSYTSGEGAFNYRTGTDTVDNRCHLSGKSYPLLLTQDLFSQVGGHSVACSGAVITDVGSLTDNYHGQVSGVSSFGELQQTQPAFLQSIMTNYLPGYVAQQRFVAQYQPRILTVSVGGDDIGFGDILQNCVEPHLSLHISDSTCYNTYEDRQELLARIDRTVARWKNLYTQLQSEAPESRIYAIGYPSLSVDNGNCAANAHLGKSELEFADEIISYLNTSIQKAAVASGVSYVDISQALVGHRLCETASYNVAVNGLTAGTDGGPLGIGIFGSESYHPNALGQQLMEQAILKQTHNFTVSPTAPSTGTATNLLNAPKSGRAVSLSTPLKAAVPRVIKRGGSAAVHVDAQALGLRPGNSYTIRLDGAGGAAIGTIAVDSTGMAAGTLTIPDTTAAGGHTIDVTGPNQTGEPIDGTQPIYVPASDTDSDGDGLDDAVDSCPGAPQSGQDVDWDGIDDTCDPLIDQQPPTPSPPAQPPTPSNNTTSTPNQPAPNSGGVTPSAGTATSDTLEAITDDTQSDSLTNDGITFVGTFSTTAASVGNTPSAALVSRVSGTVLGSHTVNPQSDKLERAISQTSYRIPRNAKPGLSHVPWLHMAMLYMVFWLLVLIAWIIGRRIHKQWRAPGAEHHKVL